MPSPDTNAIAESLPLFFEPVDVLEVRALDVGRPGRKVAGYLSAKNIGAMAREIARLADTASGVYFTPQRLRPEVLKRCKHALVEVSKGNDGKAVPQLTKDEDVTERRYLLIDIDPVRPKGVCSTDAEKETAVEVAEKVREFMSARHWPRPVVVDSGNGIHLYYRLPTVERGGPCDSATDAIATLLRVMKSKFDTPGSQIDSAVYNPSRIMKVPGTIARKGDDSPDRPHRMSAVLDVPSDWRIDNASSRKT